MNPINPKKSENTSIDWCTPPKFITSIYELMGDVELDPCSNPYSILDAKCKVMLPDNGLDVNWTEYKTIYVNPPYGRNTLDKTSIYDWIKKAHESKESSEILLLIPVATNTKHWKEFVFNSNAIWFLSDTRLKFMLNGLEYKKGAPMPCAFVYFGQNSNRFRELFSIFGHIYIINSHETSIR